MIKNTKHNPMCVFVSDINVYLYQSVASSTCFLIYTLMQTAVLTSHDVDIMHNVCDES